MYDPNEMEEFCKIHAPGLFDEVYGSILNDTRQSPREEMKCAVCYEPLCERMEEVLQLHLTGWSWSMFF